MKELISVDIHDVFEAAKTSSRCLTSSWKGFLGNLSVAKNLRIPEWPIKVGFLFITGSEKIGINQINAICLQVQNTIAREIELNCGAGIEKDFLADEVKIQVLFLD